MKITYRVEYTDYYRDHSFENPFFISCTKKITARDLASGVAAIMNDTAEGNRDHCIDVYGEYETEAEARSAAKKCRGRITLNDLKITPEQGRRGFYRVEICAPLREVNIWKVTTDDDGEEEYDPVY